MKHALSLLLASAFFSAASYAEVTQTGYIKDLRVSTPTLTNPTHFQVEGDWINKSEVTSPCHDVGYWAINPVTEDGKALLSAILTAYTSGKKVMVRDADQHSCTLRADMLDARQIDFIN